MSLPAFNGSSTQGVLITKEGDVVGLESPGSGALRNYPAASHVEGQAALQIRELGSEGGTVFHNNPLGTCNFCDKQISTLLPKGATLDVVPPADAVAPNEFWFNTPTSYVGNARTPKGLEP